MKVALAYNSRPDSINLSEKEAEDYIDFDSPETIIGIKTALEENGHEVLLLPADETFYEKAKQMKNRIDMVFNYSEGLRGRSRESHVPAMLEMLGIPYIGPGPLESAIILDKAKTKEILIYNNIPTPKFRMFHTEQDILKTKNIKLKFPVIIKPVAEGSSKGIQNDSVVEDMEQLTQKALCCFKQYNQPVIVEEFIEGREFTVAVIGNEKPVVLPIVEVKFDELPSNLRKFDSYEAKWIYDSPKENANPLVCPANLSEQLRKKIEKTCKKAYKAIGCADWTRMDVRVDNNGTPYIIETNNPPGIIPDEKENSRFPRAAKTAGITYNEMLDLILYYGSKRYGIESKIENSGKLMKISQKLQKRMN